MEDTDAVLPVPVGLVAGIHGPCHFVLVLGVHPAALETVVRCTDRH